MGVSTTITRAGGSRNRFHLFKARRSNPPHSLPSRGSSRTRLFRTRRSLVSLFTIVCFWGVCPPPCQPLRVTDEGTVYLRNKSSTISGLGQMNLGTFCFQSAKGRGDSSGQVTGLIDIVVETSAAIEPNALNSLTEVTSRILVEDNNPDTGKFIKEISPDTLTSPQPDHSEVTFTPPSPYENSTTSSPYIPTHDTGTSLRPSPSPSPHPSPLPTDDPRCPSCITFVGVDISKSGTRLGSCSDMLHRSLFAETRDVVIHPVETMHLEVVGILQQLCMSFHLIGPCSEYVPSLTSLTSPRDLNQSMLSEVRSKREKNFDATTVLKAMSEVMVGGVVNPDHMRVDDGGDDLLMNIVVKAHYTNPGLGWWGELSMTDVALYRLNRLFLWLFFLLAIAGLTSAYFLSMTDGAQHVRHPLVYMLAAAVGAFVISLFFQLLYFISFTTYGTPSISLNLMSRFSWALGRQTVYVELLLISKGWTTEVASERVFGESPRSILLGLVAYVSIWVMGVVMARSPTQTFLPSIGLLDVIFACVLMFTSYSTSLNHLDEAPKAFYLHFGVASSLYIVSSFIAFIVSLISNAMYRPVTYLAVSLMADFGITLMLVVLLWPTQSLRETMGLATGLLAGQRDSDPHRGDDDLNGLGDAHIRHSSAFEPGVYHPAAESPTHQQAHPPPPHHIVRPDRSGGNVGLIEVGPVGTTNGASGAHTTPSVAHPHSRIISRPPTDTSGLGKEQGSLLESPHFTDTSATSTSGQPPHVVVYPNQAPDSSKRSHSGHSGQPPQSRSPSRGGDVSIDPTYRHVYNEPSGSGEDDDEDADDEGDESE